MDLNRKLEMLTLGIRSISQHSDASKDDRKVVLAQAKAIIDDEVGRMDAEQDPQPEAPPEADAAAAS